MAAPASSKSGISISTLSNYGVRPLTKSNFLYYYTPIVGLSSYSLLSVNVMNPGLIVRFLPNRDVTNILLFNAVLGTGLHISSRSHLDGAAGKIRIMYSTYGAILFSFGSVLLWAVLRSVLPNNKSLATVLGLISGFSLTAVGKEYLDYIDSKTGKTLK